MNHRFLSVLLLLIVAIGFSGVASAATMQKLVSPEIPAWDEKIVDEPAWNETVPEVPAIPAVTHEQLVSDAYWIWQCDIYKWVDAVYETVIVVDTPEQVINHPAVYETIVVVDQEAYDEEIQVEADHDGFVLAGNGEYMKKGSLKLFAKYFQGQELHGFESVPVGGSDPRQSKDWKWVPVTETEIVHHEAITHEEEVLVSEAWDEVIPAVTHEEQVLVSEAGYQFIMHTDVQTAPNGYEAMIQVCSDLVPGWNMIYHPHDEFAAVFETVIDVPEVPAVPSYVIEHPEKFHMVHHDAIPAVYETVEVADPVTPVVPDEIALDQYKTGGSFVPIALAILLILAGLGIAASRRNK